MYVSTRGIWDQKDRRRVVYLYPGYSPETSSGSRINSFGVNTNNLSNIVIVANVFHIALPIVE